MPRPKKVDSSEPTVETEELVEETVKEEPDKEIANPCDTCPKTYGKKNPFCKTCVNYRG